MLNLHRLPVMLTLCLCGSSTVSIMKIEKAHQKVSFCRGTRTRTGDLLHPMQARYQAAPYPVLYTILAFFRKKASLIEQTIYKP